ncbi:MAG: hypothetical protein V4487_01640 [Chlamydiota bacterium]
MRISLQNEPFHNTKELLQIGKKACDLRPNHCRNIAYKVATIALVILSFLPLVLLDLVLYSLSCRCCRKTPMIAPGTPLPHTPPGPREYDLWDRIEALERNRPVQPNAWDLIAAMPIQQAQPAGGHQVPSAEQVRRALKSPYLQNDVPLLDGDEEADSPQFFRDAIAEALASLDPNQKPLYEQLLGNHGVYDEVDLPANIDIFQWSAACSLIHYLIFKVNFNSRHLTHTPHFLEDYLHGYLLDALKYLPDAQRAAVVLQVQNPEKIWALNDDAKELVTQIKGVAQRMTQERQFTDVYRNVYPVN